jgi:hypothetical protein
MFRAMRNALKLVPLLVALGACGGSDESSGEGPLMAAGQNCLGCHQFSAAGTVFSGSAGLSGATVKIGGATLTSNGAGNFFTGAGITFPAQVQVTSGGVTRTMTAPSGGCNGCHGSSTAAIHVP